MNAIETKNLTKRYRNGIVALQDMNIAIPYGEVIGFVGSNGAGKTTTMKILTSLTRPSNGQAYINGVNIREGPRKAMRDVGALIEVPGVYEHLTPYEMLSYFGRVHGMRRPEIDQRIEEVMAILGLSEWVGRKMGSFSTGMTRRVNIAKAILHQPKVLLLDEPVLGLDPEGIRDVRMLIRRLRDEGVTIFLSSHLLQEVSETCDQIIFIDRGRIVRTESTSEISQKAMMRVIHATFLKPPNPNELRKIGTIPGISGVTGHNTMVRIGYDGTPEASAKILDGIMGLGLNVVSYMPQQASLEDYYVSLMRGERRGG